jgi:hypothetical protein
VSQIGDEIKNRVDELYLSRELYKEQCEQMQKALSTVAFILAEGRLSLDKLNEASRVVRESRLEWLRVNSGDR